MHDAPRHDVSLPRIQIDDRARRAIVAWIEVDEQMSRQHKKEFVLLVVFVPVILAAHHADAYDRVVHATECLIEPFLAHTGGQSVDVDQLQWTVEHVESCCVGER